MQYPNSQLARFVARPNRFIATCRLHDELVQVHVKNTGRNKEILQPDVPVALVKSDNPKRKTQYDLVAAQVGARWINIDSQAPNQVAYDSILSGAIQLPGIATTDIMTLKREVTFEDARFDIFGSTATQPFFVELKGVTLANGTLAAFPDAPTSRAAKHVATLVRAQQAGYQAYLCFIVQMSGIDAVTIYAQRDPALYAAILAAKKAGVHLLAYGCAVTPATLATTKSIPIDLAQVFTEVS
ncbi:DNA/RNA nuclease SfsA [Loigolactobacillus jiayinensis]|uniref:Sugar fermentation stimulation protein homolog n=1 Tax=Loigolactobacillus jiayinensis TaxID=2486016 RepID=A0ABW1RDW8_9LACO|nr:DNA/RNA nuclease SfsA [Loigolactobacillus jiayinensis]